MEFLINPRGTKIEFREIAGKKLNSSIDCELTCALTSPSTCRANKPAARFAQCCKAHLKLKGFPCDGATLRRMHGIRNMRKSPCLYTISQCCRGNYKFGHYVAQPKLRRYSPECIFDAILSNPGKWL